MAEKERYVRPLSDVWVLTDVTRKDKKPLTYCELYSFAGVGNTKGREGGINGAEEGKESRIILMIGDFI